MRFHDIPPVVRGAGSLLLIVAGILLVYFAWFNDSDDQKTAAVDAPNTATAEPERCPSGWREFDNTAHRYTICLPANLVYYTGSATQALEDVDQSDAAFIDALVLVNLAWLSAWPEEFPADPQQPPLFFRFDFAGADRSFGGCDPSAEPEIKGVRACSFEVEVIEGEEVLTEGGSIHKFKALRPASFVPEVSDAEGWNIYLVATSPSATWSIQEPLVRRVFESIETY